MKTNNSFEDILVWQRGKELAITVYKLTNSSMFSKDFSFIDQLRRASISITNNIAEGFERQSSKEFSRFLYIAKGSAGEIRSLLIIANELGYISDSDFLILKNQVLEVSKMISGLIKYLNKE